MGPLLSQQRGMRAEHRSLRSQRCRHRHSQGLRASSDGTGMMCLKHQGQPWALRWAPLPISAGLLHASGVTGPRGQGPQMERGGTRCLGTGPQASFCRPQEATEGERNAPSRVPASYRSGAPFRGWELGSPQRGKGSKQDSMAWHRMNTVMSKLYRKHTACLAASHLRVGCGDGCGVWRFPGAEARPCLVLWG